VRAFPVLYAEDVAGLAAFYARLGFAEQFRLPNDGAPGYIGLRRDEAELAVVTVESPRQLLGIEPTRGHTFELFVYVTDVDATIAELRNAGVQMLRAPEDMFWGERVAYLADPEGNPVALASRGASPPGA
jgi:lactoylglutathione lyase